MNNSWPRKVSLQHCGQSCFTRICRSAKAQEKSYIKDHDPCRIAVQDVEFYNTATYPVIPMTRGFREDEEVFCSCSISHDSGLLIRCHHIWMSEIKLSSSCSLIDGCSLKGRVQPCSSLPAADVADSGYRWMRFTLLCERPVITKPRCYSSAVIPDNKLQNNHGKKLITLSRIW